MWSTAETLVICDGVPYLVETKREDGESDAEALARHYEKLGKFVATLGDPIEGPITTTLT